MKPLYVIISLIVVLAVLAGVGVYWYAFLRPHKNMMKSKPAYTLSSSQLLAEFSSDENAAFEKYAGQVIEVTGKIEDVKRDEKQTAIILDDKLFGISVYLDSSFIATNHKTVDDLNAGQTVTIRGQCDGMLTDVVISRAVIIQ